MIVRIFQRDNALRIVIFRYKNTQSLSVELENLVEFAVCQVEVKPKEDITSFVDAVIDSSRYFVLRLCWFPTPIC